MDHDQILEMVKRVRKVAAEELKGNQHKLDMNKNGKLDAHDFKHLRKMKEESEEVEEAMSHQAKTTMKHIKNPTQGEKDASKKMKSGIAGYRDRIAMLHSAKARGALKNEEVDLDEEQLDESSFEKELKDLQRRNREHQRSVNMGHYGSTDGTGINNQEYEKRVKELHRRHNKIQTNAHMYGHLGESAEDVELTLEDIEYIMESEDFQQLDELSKKTLTSYVQKAKADRSAKQTKKNELEGARSMINQLSAGAKGGGTQHSAGSFRATGPQYERPDVGTNLKKHMPAIHKQLVKMHQKLQADRVETNRVIKKRDAGVKGAESRIERMKTKSYRNEEVEIDEAKAPSGSPFSKNYKSQMPDDQKTSTKTYHDVKKTSTGTMYTKQSDAEGISKGTGDDAAKASEPKEKRGRGRPVGSKSGARQAGSASKTDYRGFVTHTLNLPASR